MDLAFAVQIGRETLYTALLLSLPTVVVSLAVGLLVWRPLPPALARKGAL